MIPILLKRVGALVVNFAFPLRCTGCGAWDTLLCDRCHDDLRAILMPFCTRCGAPLPATPVGVCPTCASAPLNALDGVRACFAFDGVIRDAVHDLKYQSVSAMAGPLGSLLADCLRFEFPPVTALLPVPLHTSRKRQRGYNQAAELARHAGAAAGIPVWDDVLIRVRATPTQTRLDAADRRQNVLGAFAAGGRNIAGADLVLIDDVMTTGATLDACATVLKVAGARTVRAAVLARDL